MSLFSSLVLIERLSNMYQAFKIIIIIIIFCLYFKTFYFNSHKIVVICSSFSRNAIVVHLTANFYFVLDFQSLFYC